MKLGVIADDFTGASDIALTLAEGGMRTTQFIGVPDAPADANLDAGVIALKSRTAPVDAAISDSLAACDWLRAQGAEQIILKVCSTFDSTPKGNIGPVLEVLAERLAARHIFVCPAFPENGRSVYQGHLFVGDVLLSESGMQDHPLTPMTDADLRRVLGAQTGWDVAHIPIGIVASGADAIQNAVPDGPAMIIVDAIHDGDLHTLGRAAQDHSLLCGGSGIALGLPANFGATAGTPEWVPMEGPGVVISGSCSRATRGQVEAFRQTHPSLEIVGEDAVNGTLQASDLADWVMAQDKTPMLFSSADPEAVKANQDRFGVHIVANAIENLFAELARELVARGVTRIVVAGGETSGAVTSGLATTALEIGPRIAPGVPVVRLADKPVALALKSGNFGDAWFFERALEIMKGGA